MTVRIRRGYVETRDGQIHYREAGERRPGQGQGPASERPLVLLHQTASSSAMYEGLMAQLAPHFWIVAPDTPGFGESFCPPQRATMAYYARVLVEALAGLGITGCHLFGHHTGASIAVQLLTDVPTLAERLALSGPPYLSPAQKQAFRDNIRPLVLRPDGAHLVELWERLKAKDGEVPLALTHREFLLNLQAGERYHEAYLAVAEHDFEGQLAALTCPVLVMSGTRDSLWSSLEPAFQGLQRGQKQVLGDTSTYVCDRAPERLASLLIDFFGVGSVVPGVGEG